MIRLNATRFLRPHQKYSAREWLPKHVQMPVGTETAGMPFSLAAFPHVDSVLDAFDDPKIRQIVLQWASRLGKTTTCLSLMAKVAGTNPRNMMFAGPTKDAAGRVIGSRLYPILGSAEGVRQQLPPEARRSKLHVKLESCQIFVGWSGSETSLADVGAFFGHASEIDKWDDSASKEGDSLKLFVNRFKGFPDHKIIFESTPTIAGRSRIEKKMTESNQHRRYVPCPHCGEFQVLIQGVEGVPGGFDWDRDSSGKSDPDVALQTGHYVCKFCQKKIENHHRTVMLRAGVWVPNGCTITPDGTIHGKALKDGSDVVGFGPLASWYALTETWGNFARLWIQAQKRPRDLQDVVNSYKGETWAIRKSKSTPEKVGIKLRTDIPRRLLPDWTRLVTVTIDQQRSDGGYRLWVCLAHGINRAAHVVDYGLCQHLEEVWDRHIRSPYQHEDGGNPMMPHAAAADSGWDTKKTYDFCNAHNGMLPLKGSSGDISGGLPYKVAEVESGQYKGQSLFTVNTDFWETDLQARLDERDPGEDESLSLCAGADGDFEFLEQLCNGTLTDRVDGRNQAKLLWVKKDESLPNDYRDAVRYGLCLAHAYIDENGGYPPRSNVWTQSKTVVNSGTQRPDGRNWNE
jgi:phage terminase large subunit GpA-like protein